MAQPLVALKENQGSEVDELVELPEEFHWLEGKQSYIVCGFYTPNYLAQITSMKRSLEKMGINHFVKRYERLDTWEATTRLKPVFIDYCLKKFPDHDILYLDADAVVRKPLSFFDTVTTDVCMAFHPIVQNRKHYLRISAGTVFCRNTEGGRRFAELWKAQESKAKPFTVDEDMIYMAFSDMKGISITIVPPEYYKIYDRSGVDPVIEHFQASRYQFKWPRFFRRARQIATVVTAIIVAVFLIWWLPGKIDITWR